MTVKPDPVEVVVRMIEAGGPNSEEVSRFLREHRDDPDFEEVREIITHLREEATTSRRRQRTMGMFGTACALIFVGGVSVAGYRAAGMSMELAATKSLLATAQARMQELERRAKELEVRSTSSAALASAHAARVMELEERLRVMTVRLTVFDKQLEDTTRTLAALPDSDEALRALTESFRELAERSENFELAGAMQKAVEAHASVYDQRMQALSSAYRACESTETDRADQVWRLLAKPILLGEIETGLADRCFSSPESAALLESLLPRIQRDSCEPGLLPDCFAIATASRLIGNGDRYRNLLASIEQYNGGPVSSLAAVELHAHTDATTAFSELATILGQCGADSPLDVSQQFYGRLARQVAANLNAQGLHQFAEFLKTKETYPGG